jgi:hypothetical protein
MIVKFGSGDVAVTNAAHGEDLKEDTPSTMLIIEPGKGTGIINGKVPYRYRGASIDLEEYKKSHDKIVFEFANAESVDVVIEKLQKIRDDLAGTVS